MNMEEKQYRLLKQGDVIRLGDEYQSANPPYDWEPASHGIGEIWCSKRHVPYRRPVPQWQTGEVPEPNGHCIVFMEFKDKSVTPVQEIASWYCEDQSCWKWAEFKPLTDLKERKIHHLYTGRWFIQPIILPS